MKAEQADELRQKMKELCDEYGLGHVIWAGTYEDDEPEGQNHLGFIAPDLEERKADVYVLHNWLWRTAQDVAVFARRTMDSLVSQHQLVAIPAATLRGLVEAQNALNEAKSEAVGAPAVDPEALVQSDSPVEQIENLSSQVDSCVESSNDDTVEPGTVDSAPTPT